MIFRLEYCNKFGDVARVDIETPNGSGVEEIRGTGNPFQLQYKTEATDKRGRFMTSSAEINIYENDLFNIDTLKTSSETDIKVSFYINSALTWQGFIIPDFFSKDIGKNSVVSMTASDRINTLKSVTLLNTDERTRIRYIAQSCLEKTGLTLPLLTMADFISEDGLAFFNTFIQTQRLYDEKGKSVNCYDILESILISSNSYIVQRKGAWQIVNKYQLEDGIGLNYSGAAAFLDWESEFHDFDFVRRGARRTITPVASSVGVIHEYGGGRRYPKNYDFRQSGIWTAKNGFSYTRDNREVLHFSRMGTIYTPVFGSVTNNYVLYNKSNITIQQNFDFSGSAYLESPKIDVPVSDESVKINVTVNALSYKTISSQLTPSAVYLGIIAESTTETLILNRDNEFVPISNNINNLYRIPFGLIEGAPSTLDVITKNETISATLTADYVANYKVSIRIYGSGVNNPTLIDFAKFTFESTKETSKGTLYKTTTDGGNFTKEHKDETTIFGDFLTNGLNGYFYDYPSDDTSSIFQDETKTQIWTAPNETESLPLLQQVTRQKARIFSVAHDIIRGDIDVKNFDPLAIFKDCNNKEYVVVSAEFDFLRSVASVEIEEIAYKNIDRRDYIYSYFGDENN